MAILAIASGWLFFPLFLFCLLAAKGKVDWKALKACAGAAAILDLAIFCLMAAVRTMIVP